MSMLSAVGEIPFEIEMEDSCNCCHWWFSKCCIKSSSIIYITHDIAAEPFDTEKSHNHQEDIEKSVNRLLKHIEGLTQFVQSDELFAFQERKVVIYDDIRKINEKIREIQRTFKNRVK